MKKILLTILTTSIMASAAFAGSTMVSSGKTSKEPMAPECDLYRANEFSIDLFGSYHVTGEGDQRLFGDHAFGGGFAANYFFTKNIGLGLEVQGFGTRHGEVQGSSALNLTYRMPLGCTGWAPYAFVGGGVVTNSDSNDDDEFGDVTFQDGDDILWEGHAGIGIAYRFSRSFGVFTDARYTMVEGSENNFMTARTGVTFAF